MYSRSQRWAFIKGHYDERSSVARLVNSVDRADVGMIKRRSKLCFLQETLLFPLAGSDFIRKELQGYGTIELQVSSAVNQAHTAFARMTQDHIIVGYGF